MTLYIFSTNIWQLHLSDGYIYYLQQIVEHREWLRKKYEMKRKIREQKNKDRNRGKSPIGGDIMYGTHTGEYEKG